MTTVLKPARAASRADSLPTARVLQVVLRMTPGGTEHLVLEICKRIRHEFEVTVCCLDDEGEWATDLRAEGIDVVALRRQPGFRPGVGRQIAALAAERRIDLLHCHQYSPFVYGWIASQLNRRLKVVYTEHGRLSDAPPSWKRRMVNPILSRFRGEIVAVSHELRDYMLDSRFAASRVGVIHNGIEPGTAPTFADRLRARHVLGLDEAAFVVMAVARLDPVKDFPTLIDAFAIVRAQLPRARLVIVGDGPERARLEACAARPDVAGSVDIIGYRAGVRQLLPAADLYVSSSISEGISITILEAMAARVAVVATAVGGTPEVLPSEAAGGVLVPSRDAAQLASAIISLERDTATRAAIAAAGRRRLESAFTIDRMVGDYMRTYRRLLG
ncbi:MAG TPA: glycosyltransferase [Vicinamibacterales bacterium]|nr:glycosyltransferase [Vicinamibacterales bacterium]